MLVGRGANERASRRRSRPWLKRPGRVGTAASLWEKQLLQAESESRIESFSGDSLGQWIASSLHRRVSSGLLGRLLA